MQTNAQILPNGYITISIPNKLKKKFDLQEKSVFEVEQTEEGLLLKPVSHPKIKMRSLKEIRKGWTRYQDEIGDALDKIAKLPKNKRPLLFR